MSPSTSTPGRTQPSTYASPGVRPVLNASGTIGMFFPSRTGRAAAVRLSMGRRYIFLGFSWGINVRRALSLF